MRRPLTIILIVLLIISLILVGIWLRTRKQATESGREAPSFRAFLGLGEGKRGTSSPGGGLTLDDGTPPPDDTTGGTPSIPPPTVPSGVAVSQFTSGPLTPTQNLSNPPLSSTGSGSSTSPGSSGGNSVGTLNPGQGPGSVPPGTGPTGPGGAQAPLTPACTDSDTNITFTAVEIERLNILQSRFYDIAETLSTDKDVETALFNYAEFKAKADKIAELYNYCIAKSPLINDQVLKTRVGTPFWRNATIDRNGYMPSSTPSVSLSALLAGDAVDPRSVNFTQNVIQKIFKVNLW